MRTGSDSAAMDRMDLLAKERRARLAAERLLDQKSRELFAANEKLATHAAALSDRILAERSAARVLQTEADALKDQRSRALRDLEIAHTTAVTAERRLRASIDAFRDGFAVFDAEHRLVVANRAWMAPFDGLDVRPGITWREVLQVCAREGLVETGPEGAEAFVEATAARWALDPIPSLTLRFARGLWLKLVERRTPDGDIVSLAVNVTEQKRILSAIEAIPDGFVLFDRDTRVIMANERYAHTIPGLEGRQVIGMTLLDILRHGLAAGAYPDATGREEDWIAERLAFHEAAEGESIIETTDGRSIRIINRPTPDGGRVGLRVDITEFRRQQAALEAARIEAEAANRAKSAFLANMSHEIRTPMNGVVGMAELLCDTALTEDQRLYAETIRSSGEALLVIINDILDYSKIEAERLTLHPEAFDLERTVHEVAMLLQPRARSKGIDLMIDYDLFLPTRFTGDPGRVRQILTNLMGNAVKFTAAGHVLVRVVGIEGEDGAHRLHVTVEDTGIGIPPDQLSRIFDEFSQVESAANRKFEGTGLGLAITRRLIERMGGTIWVDSEEGRGSSFGFRLDLPVAEGDTAPVVPVALRHALVVDDQFINRTILERQLAACGIRTTLCRSGAEGLAALAAGPVDVIITDHEMPEMSGLDFALALRAAGHAAPIVMLSSNPSAAREGKGARELAAVVQKPVLRSELFARLRALSDAPPEAAPAAVPPPAPTVAARAMRVLAAEDNRTNQLVFRKMVKDFALDLMVVGNGREAVEAWRDFQPDLIFMDISMPEMDGREAARAIRTAEAGTGRHVPIVALTAHAMEGDAAGILAAGIDRYLTKPLRRSAIAEALRDYRPPGALPLADPATLEAVVTGSAA